MATDGQPVGDDSCQTFLQFLRSHPRTCAKTQIQIAAEVGISASSLNQHIHGSPAPKAVRDLIAAYLGITDDQVRGLISQGYRRRLERQRAREARTATPADG